MQRPGTKIVGKSPSLRPEQSQVTPGRSLDGKGGLGMTWSTRATSSRPSSTNTTRGGTCFLPTRDTEAAHEGGPGIARPGSFGSCDGTASSRPRHPLPASRSTAWRRNAYRSHRAESDALNRQKIRQVPRHCRGSPRAWRRGGSCRSRPARSPMTTPDGAAFTASLSRGRSALRPKTHRRLPSKARTREVGLTAGRDGDAVVEPERERAGTARRRRLALPAEKIDAERHVQQSPVLGPEVEQRTLPPPACFVPLQ